MEYRSCKCLLLDHVLKEKDALKTQLKVVEDKNEELRLEKERTERGLEKQNEELKKESEKVKAAKDDAQIAKYRRDGALYESEEKKITQNEKLNETMLNDENVKNKYRDIELRKNIKESEVEITKYECQENFHKQTIDKQLNYYNELRKEVKYPSIGKYCMPLTILLVLELFIIFIFWRYLPKDCLDDCTTKQICIYIIYTMLFLLFVGIGCLSAKVLYDCSKQYMEDKEKYKEWQTMINNKIIKLIP